MEVQISPGEIVMPASGKTLRFNKTFPDGKKILLTLNNQTRKILIFVSNVGLSGLADPPLARFAIPTLANAMWGFVIHLEQANKAGTLLKF